MFSIFVRTLQENNENHLSKHINMFTKLNDNCDLTALPCIPRSQSELKGRKYGAAPSFHRQLSHLLCRQFSYCAHSLCPKGSLGVRNSHHSSIRNEGRLSHFLSPFSKYSAVSKFLPNQFCSTSQHPELSSSAHHYSWETMDCISSGSALLPFPWAGMSSLCRYS